MTNLEAVVLGADIGGSTTRVAVAGTDGRVIAETRGGPGNPVGVGMAESIATVGATISATLAAAARIRGVETVRVDRAAIGLAGVSSLRGTPDADRFLTGVLPGVRTRLVSDFAVAFASGTWRHQGVVTIAGTGSGAMEIDRASDVARRDGWGWLLGDEGSGFWLGREAVRATLRQLEGGTTGPLAGAVTAALDAADLSGVVSACYRRAPRELAELAPLVAQTAADDDTARALLARAAELVGDRLVRLIAGRTDLPVVLAGSLVTGSGPLARDVTQRLREHRITDVREAGDGVAGALWVALHDRSGNATGGTVPGPIADTAEPARQWSALLGSLEACRRNAPTDV